MRGWLGVCLSAALVANGVRRWWSDRRAVARARLPETTADVPILGFKAARLHLPSFRFAPITYPAGGAMPYAIDDDAVCSLPRTMHDAPKVDCTCGFYALRSGCTQPLLRAPLLLEVELSGTVIVHEHGWRAQHQRVLHVWLGLCAGCGQRRAKVLAVKAEALDGVAGDPATDALALCDGCATTQLAVQGEGFVRGSMEAPQPLARLDPWWRPRTILGPAELAARLGVPVSEGVPPAA